MKLLVDIGNSRVKWALLEQGALGSTNVCERCAGNDESSLADAFGALPAPKAVFICNVAGSGMERAARTVCRDLWGIDPVFAVPVREAAGVVNGYRDPAQLGADRWLAVLAAVERYGCPLCLVGCGTAVTVDAVDAERHHLGGFIVPGMALMARALETGTQLRPDGTKAADAFGRSTNECIANGALAAVVALADRTFSRLRAAYGDALRCVVTGGAAPSVIPALDTDVVHDPDLVIAGLALLAGGPAGQAAAGAG